MNTRRIRSALMRFRRTRTFRQFEDVSDSSEQNRAIFGFVAVTISIQILSCLAFAALFYFLNG